MPTFTGQELLTELIAMTTKNTTNALALLGVPAGGAWERLPRLFSRRRPEVLQTSVDVGPRKD